MTSSQFVSRQREQERNIARRERAEAKAARREKNRVRRAARDVVLPAEVHTFGHAHPDAEPAS